VRDISDYTIRNNLGHDFFMWSTLHLQFMWSTTPRGSYELGQVDLLIEICQFAGQLDQVQKHLFEHLLKRLCCFKLFNYFLYFFYNFFLCHSLWKPSENQT